MPKVRTQSIHSRTETINEILLDAQLAAEGRKEAANGLAEQEKEGGAVGTEDTQGMDGETKPEGEHTDMGEKEKGEESNKKAATDTASKDDADEGEWVPLSVNLGVPLFDPRLNAEVCARIEKHKLFFEENIQNNTKFSGRMCNGLLDFIELHQAPDYRFEVEPGIIPYPTKIIEFNGRTLCKSQPQ